MTRHRKPAVRGAQLEHVHILLAGDLLVQIDRFAKRLPKERGLLPTRSDAIRVLISDGLFANDEKGY